MSGSLRLGILIILGVLALGIAYKIVSAIIAGVWHLVFTLVLPLAVVAGVGFLLYGLFSRKALGGNRRYLP
jgi:hypothetical protein